jgi:predicted MFS family arabinose efflux permease
MPWRDVVFLAVLTLAFLLGLVFVQLFNTWPVYLRSVYMLLEDKIGLLLALNAVMIVLIEMPLVYKLEKRNAIKIMQVGSILFLSGFVILPYGNTFAYAVGTVFLFTWGEMLVFPLMAGFVANRAPDQTRGKYMGMYTFTFALCYVIGPFIGTWVYEHYGAQVLWAGCGVIFIPVFWAFRYLRGRLDREGKIKG